MKCENGCRHSARRANSLLPFLTLCPQGKKMKALRLFCICLALLLAIAFSQPPAPAARKFARGQNGMVSTGSPYATAAALRILAAGGNAIDAAVAAHFALMVAD